MTNSKNPPNWKIGVWPGIALGMGLGVTQHNLLLGIALNLFQAHAAWATRWF
ncbi:hypothetical protein [Nonomuraea glycinis]|uniref:hypothetical protein n=1 Tax=Nonomuraea glycinis TaxID=2047744 RepID=UPI002E117264|nr:hypothetical protein OHA68_14650 [Nonomuraea glycinis]